MRLASHALFLAMPVACAPEPPSFGTGGSSDESPDGSDTGLGLDTGEGGGLPGASGCPVNMVAIEATTLTLGETDPGIQADFPGTVIEPVSLELDAFCVAWLPFPGRPGADWPGDGLTWDDLVVLEDLLEAHGRRPCSTGELMLAAAGPDNWRHPYDAEDRIEGVCEADDMNPGPIGAHPDCQSPLGVRDFEVRSHWATLDAPIRAVLAPHYPTGFAGDGRFAVWGGTSRIDTFYAPSNFGVHFHGPGEDAYLDDAFRPCADPGATTEAQDASWADFVDAFVTHDSWATALEG